MRHRSRKAAQRDAEGGLATLTFDYRGVGGSHSVGGQLVGLAANAARWGRHPRYILSWAERLPQARYDSVTCPLLSLAIADDRFYAPRPAVQALVTMYPKTRSELRLVTPGESGPIGHFGFFKERHRQTHWREALGWIEGALRLPG